MLKSPLWCRWLLLAVAAILLGWLALSLPPSEITPQQQAEYGEPSNRALSETRQDITAEIIAHYTKVLAWFTGLLAVATVFLILVGWIQSEHLRRSVDEAKAASIRELRAYVGAEFAKSIYIDAPQFAAQIKIRNFGETPAYKVKAQTYVKAFNPPPPKGFEVFTDEFQGGSVLNPGAETTIVTPPTPVLSEIDVAAIKDGTKELYSWAEVRFVDAFRKERWIKIRTIWHRHPGDGFGGWRFCEFGNETSEDNEN